MSNKNNLEKNNHKSENSFKKVGAGILFGVIIGVAAGILIAPKSGKESRQELERSTKKVAEKFKQATNSITKNIKNNKDIIPKKMKFTYSSSKNSEEKSDKQ